MSEQNTFVASDVTVGRNLKPNRKAPKQISFRVSESEYLKLQQSAETLNMSVPVFVKKKAQGARLVAPKLDQATRQSVAKDLSMLGANANQIAKYCNQHQHEAPNYKALERNISELRERLKRYMATTKLGNTKSASRAINYAEKRAEEKSGLNCDVDYAKSAFKQTRALYGKEDGIQAHTIIQSFKPGEVTPEQCNQLGLELAEKIAPNHQVAVYTHADTDHVHNHIVINSIDLETGRKYQSNKKQREFVKKANDDICVAHHLSIPNRQAQIRYTQAEKGIVFDREEYSWKDELRELIENAKTHTSNLETFSAHLEAKRVKKRNNLI